MNVPLTPLRFLIRAEQQFGPKTGVIEGECSWTYSEFAARCRRLAGALGRLELPSGGRVAFLGGNTTHLLEACYGVPLAGGILLPLNVRLTPKDFAAILVDAGVDILLLEAGFIDAIGPLRQGVATLRHCVQLAGQPATPWLHPASLEELVSEECAELSWDLMAVNEDAVAEMFYTSGTTGDPKGVMLTHRNLYLHALGNVGSMRHRDSDVYLHTIGLFHANGWGFSHVITSLGATHVLLPRFEARTVLAAIERYRVTTFALVPTMATALLECPELVKTDVGSVRLIILGGAVAGAPLVRALETAFGCECLGGYGLTEAAPVVSHAAVKSHLELSEDRRRELQATAGFPTFDVEVALRAADGSRLAWDGRQVGELIVRGDGVMAGYWSQADESARLTEGGWLRTGDLATISPDGYITIVDRIKDIIVSGGENISSLEVERTLCAHPAVLEAVVLPVPDPEWGETPLACVVLRRGASAESGELIDHCRDRLAHFKCPRRIEFFDELPKGGTGKVLKKELRERYWKGYPRRVN